MLPFLLQLYEVWHDWLKPYIHIGKSGTQMFTDDDVADRLEALEA
jgi:hypothetical protein